MNKRDAFSSVSVEEIRALRGDVIPELVAVIEERADARDVGFGKIARRLPDGWRQILLAARALEDIEETECLAGAFMEVRRERDVRGVEMLFRSIGATELARQFQHAREYTSVLVDEDMDPLDIEELRDITADELDLPAARAALTKRALSMTAPFPAAA